MKRLALRLIRAYQRRISPNSPPSCRFYPTCSEYGAQAIEHYGVVRGGAKTAWRIARCNPMSAGGYDPAVPEEEPQQNESLATAEAAASGSTSHKGRA
jgi:putative membrane protein insertion efficiency factor